MSNAPTDGDSGAARSELTISAIVVGLLLSVVMGAANVYLGLRVGMTVSASIPAAVVGLAILNGVMRRRSILEANLVQTSASAGESLAAGIIFTVPALVLVGIWEDFDYVTTTGIALAGGLLGILFMIPMRRVFVVDNAQLTYPEGVACAEVLRTAERASAGEASGAGLIFGGLGIGAVFKFAQSQLGVFHKSVEWATTLNGRIAFFGFDVAPALLGVGVIVGLPIATQVFAGGAIGWLITIPILGSAAAGEGTAVEQAVHLWDTQVRYMGVGTMVVGGVVSIWKVRGGLVAAVRELAKQLRGSVESVERTNQNLNGSLIGVLAVVCVAMIAGLYYQLLKSVPITALTTVVMVLMSFFFTAVASYIVGLVGNSNSPVSGMTITAVLGTGGMIYLLNSMGWLEADGTKAIVATLGVAGIVCCVACTSGDVCNDLKTGYMVGASPRSQQIMQVGGVLVASVVMAPVLTMLHVGSINQGGTGIGGDDLPAPQAKLFAALANGFFGDKQLPWDMVSWGVGIGVALVVIDFFLGRSKQSYRLHVMPVAVGIYLPFGLSVPILGGGILNAAVSRTTGKKGVSRGVLIASGVIAGESLLGVAMGWLSYRNVKPWHILGEGADTAAIALSCVGMAAIAAWMYLASARSTSE